LSAHLLLPGKLTIRGNQVLEDGKPIKMHGINYFGQQQTRACSLFTLDLMHPRLAVAAAHTLSQLLAAGVVLAAVLTSEDG
jgi:hypothetical protein